MKRKLKIEQILSENFFDAFCDVKDVSFKHKGHLGYKEGEETHFEISIISDRFIKLTRVERHRLLNSLLENEFNNGLHAISYNLLTKSEV